MGHGIAVCTAITIGAAALGAVLALSILALAPVLLDGIEVS